MDRKGVLEILKDIKRFKREGYRRSCWSDHFSGSTFTVSSLGIIGWAGITPIVNASDEAILGVGRLATQPTWRKMGSVATQDVVVVILDNHQAINGVEAGRFM